MRLPPEQQLVARHRVAGSGHRQAFVTELQRLLEAPRLQQAGEKESREPAGLLLHPRARCELSASPWPVRLGFLLAPKASVVRPRTTRPTWMQFSARLLHARTSAGRSTRYLRPRRSQQSKAKRH
jgi:hypothetical protein